MSVRSLASFSNVAVATEFLLTDTRLFALSDSGTSLLEVSSLVLTRPTHFGAALGISAVQGFVPSV